MKVKIGIVIPCFNNLEVLKFSIKSVYTNEFFIVLFDDNSDDETEYWIKKNFPKINYLNGDGNNWWTGSTAKGINFCIENNCDYVLNLNADVIISPKTIKNLLKTSIDNNHCIVSSLVLSINKKNQIIWSGSKFNKIYYWLPILTSKYIYKSGTLISEINDEIYEVDEVHGRGVIIPISVFKKIGNYDSKTFPHYGGDTDFSFRAKKNNIKMLLDPTSKVYLFDDNTGLKRERNMSFSTKLKQIWNYLTNRKNGEALVVWFNLYKKHVKIYYAVPSYVFVILLNIYRRLF